MDIRQKCTIHQIVEYIKLFEFNFDVHDVAEDMDSILHHYGIDRSLTDEENDLLRKELMTIASDAQLVEIVKCVEEHIDPLLLLVKPRKLCFSNIGCMWKAVDLIEKDDRDEINLNAMENNPTQGTV